MERNVFSNNFSQLFFSFNKIPYLFFKYIALYMKQQHEVLMLSLQCSVLASTVKDFRPKALQKKFEEFSIL